MTKDVVAKSWALPAVNGVRYSAGGLFPLSVHASGRYLQAATGQPFLVHGDTAWSIAVQLTRAQVATYLDDRQSKGFNTILFNAIEHFFSDNDPPDENVEGERPFTSATDFASPNEGYWDFVDFIVSECLAREMLCIINPAYLGYQGGQEGFMSEVSAASAGDLQTYGAFLANRYTQGNVIWCMGGDYGGDLTERNKQWNIVKGMRTVRSTDLITCHGARTESAYSLWAGFTGFNLNNIYTNGLEYTFAATEYARSPAMPFILLEGYYEETTLGAGLPADVRRQAWVSLLSGACGHLYGSHYVWDFGSADHSGGGAANALANELDMTGAQDMQHVIDLFTAYEWQLLVPETGTTLVTSSLGTGTARIAPALASNGSFAMVWKPSSGSVTVNMAALSPSSIRARFYDPTNGTFSSVSGSPFANAGTQSINWPGERILVLDAA